MRIKSLQIHGFKSFVDKTLFTFRPGITGIVGPNGCGKSNVVDAIRWSMGEQSPRRLRGKGMEDVIFAGSDSRQPIGMAEVVLSFDNSDGSAPAQYAPYSEIQISRRLYRSGESEYLINRTPVRLRDVQDFFRDTGIGTRGYTIVEQGQIAGIVSAKPEERRYLIEEAAGIGKYKARRQEAERKIEGTEQNLVRVSDVLGEIKRQIGSLERQAKKAARYKRLRETQRLLELSLAAEDRRDLLEQVEHDGRLLAQLQGEATALETQVAERELALEQRRIEMTERERALEQDTERLIALRGDIKELEGRIAYERREREALAEMNAARREDIARLDGQLAEARSLSDRARAEERELTEALDAHSGVIVSVQQRVADAEVRFRALGQERDAANAALVDVLTRLGRCEDRLGVLAQRRDAMTRRLEAAELELARQGHEADRASADARVLDEGLAALVRTRDELGVALQDAIEAVDTAGRRVREQTESARAVRERCESRRARLASLREVIERSEDLGGAARHLLDQGDHARDAFGLLAVAREVIETDRDVEGAVEAVLAERAEALVVRDLSGALSAVDMLREASAGRGVFLVRPAEPPGPAGFVPLGQRLLERVRPRPGFEDVVRTLLVGVYLVDDLRQVIDVYGSGRIPATFVTAAGDVLTPDGVVRGGAQGAGSGLLTRMREVRELESELMALEFEVKGREDERTSAEALALAASNELDAVRTRHHAAVLALAGHEKDLERARDRVESLGAAHESRVAEQARLAAEAAEIEAERARIEEDLLGAREGHGLRQQALDDSAARLGDAGRSLADAQSALSACRVEHATRVEKREGQLEAARRADMTARETEEWIARREQEIAAAEERREALALEIAGTETTLAARLADEEAARVSSEQKREIFERAAESVRELEAAVRGIRSEGAARRDAAAQTGLRLRETEMRLDHLVATVRERWTLDLAAWEPPSLAAIEASEVAVVTQPVEMQAASETEPAAAVSATTGESGTADGEEEPALTPRAAVELVQLPRDERRARLDDVRRRVEGLGEVNLGAIEEHEELAERLRFLSEQKQDLENTLASLREAIQRINRTSRKRFRETFDAVAARFAENFPRLFGGGKATLTLTEEEDVLDAGIEIMASPPGKRVVNVNALSGGEKTLTAVALLVSVFQVRPSPFFLLDEVDAALDDANVGRFNEIVKELSGESQFLVVTHNKRTIEIGDILYGVTMEEQGVSKLVSVELH